jgi:nuclease HARBI1
MSAYATTNMFPYMLQTGRLEMAYLLAIDQHRHNRRRLPKPRVYRDRSQPFEVYDDEELIRRYRLPRQCILDLCGELQHKLERPTRRAHALPVATQVFTALQFYATGSFQRVDGDVHGVSQSSVSRIVNNVSVALFSCAVNYIQFPTEADDERRLMADFHKIANFPSVLGCIDGTQIAILAPRENEHLYVCRKGFHALNVQVVCDARMQFLNVVAKWPGATHDSFKWQNSCLYRYFANRQPGQHGWLLGDSGYPLSSCLLTPVLNSTTAAELRYNKSHIRTCNTVERAIGLLKTRFRCLHKSGGCLLSPPDRCAKIITACCVLHNICIKNSVPEPEIVADADSEDTEIYSGTNSFNDNRVRNNLICHRYGSEQ